MSNLIKWSGSKDSQAKQIIKYFPENIENYYEPFLGGGSIFLSLLESNIHINNYYVSDKNKELMGIYDIIKKCPEFLIDVYKKHYIQFNSRDIQYRKDYFNSVRCNFNENKKSEDFYWIMRVCTNGMPRYNRNNKFNTSCHFSRPGMDPGEVERLVMKYHNLFILNSINFSNCNYNDIISGSNDLVYCDPPYQNTKNMYFSIFDNIEFIKWINKLDSKWILSYDGKINNNVVGHIAPYYIRHEYLISGNSSFRRVIGNSNNSIISESIYLNY